MSHAPAYELDRACAECGRFGAYAFDGERLCVDCYHQRGSCCAERESAGGLSDSPLASASALAPCAMTVASHEPVDEIHRLNPNCCYTACPRCSSMRRLREFQARQPEGWRDRLRGFPRLVRRALGRD